MLLIVYGGNAGVTFRDPILSRLIPRDHVLFSVDFLRPCLASLYLKTLNHIPTIRSKYGYDQNVRFQELVRMVG